MELKLFEWVLRQIYAIRDRSIAYIFCEKLLQNKLVLNFQLNRNRNMIGHRSHNNIEQKNN